jgi:pilus assembly protein CpaD
MTLIKKLALGASCIAFAAMAGCGSFPGTTDPNLPMQYEERHPITVRADQAEMQIAVDPQSVALLRVDETRLRAFAASYRSRGHGPLVIQVPSETPNSMAATQVLADVNAVLRDEGLQPDEVQSRPYRTAENPERAPLMLHFTRYSAEASPCGDWSESYSQRFNGNPTPNWGCATQNNLAAMVSEPADLVTPRDMTPANAEQRSGMLERYRNGRDTNTTRTDGDSAAIATEVQ